MEGKRKRGGPRKRWINEAEEDKKIMGTRNWHTVARDRRKWRTLVEAKVHNGLWCLKRRRKTHEVYLRIAQPVKSCGVIFK